MIGIDEVGRGAWAGPLLVVAARQKQQLPPLLDDSKKLSKAKRNSLYNSITLACDIGEGWVDAQVIDKVGLTQAMRLAVNQALNAIDVNSEEEIIMDGHLNHCSDLYKNVSCVVRADATIALVSAASIYAKVTRDQYMKQQALLFPNYGFESHVGYGTKKHYDALLRHGISTLHRISYKPVKALL